MKKHWWKIIAIALSYYVLMAGLLLPVPQLPLIGESIRNLFFHVPIWFSMILLLGAGVFYSIRFLSTSHIKNDLISSALTYTGIFLGIAGIVSGSVWAKFTWGNWWVDDPKLKGSAISLFMYFAWMILRNSLKDEHVRARLSAVYNIFAFVMLIFLVLIIPRLSAFSLHPGADNNPVLPKNMEPQLRWVFYPAILAWTLLSLWLTNIYIRIRKLENMEE